MQYVEKLELTDLITVSDDCCRDRNLNAGGFTLHMKNEDIKMIVGTFSFKHFPFAYDIYIYMQLKMHSKQQHLPFAYAI